MRHPPKVRLLVTLGNVEVWICQAMNGQMMMGPLVLGAQGERVGQLICFEVNPPAAPSN